MARYVLKPCKLREECLVPSKEPAIEFDWTSLKSELAPSNNPVGIRNLRVLQVQAFVGLLAHPKTGVLTNFVLINQDRSGDLTRIMKQDPNFSARLRKVYRVETVQLDARLVESAR